jgi:hypothetical protein
MSILNKNPYISIPRETISRHKELREKLKMETKRKFVLTNLSLDDAKV